MAQEELDTCQVMQTWRDRLRFKAVPCWALVGLLVVTIVGAFFRLYRLSERGIWDSDSGSYILDARMFVAGIRLVLHRWGFDGGQTVQEILNYYSLHSLSSFSGKPAHAFMQAVAMLVFGDTTASANLVMALLGIVTIPLVFGLTQRLFHDPRISLVAAGLMAISPAHVSYSRGFKSEADGALFMLLALWMYYEAGVTRREGRLGSRWIWASGFSLGMAAACSMRLFFVCAAFMLLIVAADIWCTRHSWKLAVADFVRLGAALCTVVVLWELPYHWAMLAAHQNGIQLGRFYTFWSSIALRTKYATSDWGLDGFPTYFFFLSSTDALLPWLAITGAVASVKFWKRFEHLSVIVFVGIGLFYFWYTPFRVPVIYSFSLPVLCILAALGMHTIFDHPFWRRCVVARNITVGMLAMASVAWGGWGSWRLLHNFSHIAEATQWLRDHRPNDKLLAVMYEPTVCEYDNAHVAQLHEPLNVEFLRRARQAGFTLLMIDYQKLAPMLSNDYPLNEQLLASGDAFKTPLTYWLESNTRPIAVITNDFNASFFPIWACEQNLRLSRTRLFLKYVNPRVDGAIRIYDLDQVLQTLESLRHQGLSLEAPPHP